MPVKKRLLAERFWEKVNKTNYCWEWTASKHLGYGSFAIERSHPIGAHRVSWELTNGPIPENLFVCHHCDNRGCVRPDHLFLGTQKDNIVDMLNKDRATTANRGSGSGRTQFTVEDVKKMRELSKDGKSMAEIGRQFEVAGTTVSRIVHRKRWKYEG